MTSCLIETHRNNHYLEFTPVRERESPTVISQLVDKTNSELLC